MQVTMCTVWLTVYYCTAAGCEPIGGELNSHLPCCGSGVGYCAFLHNNTAYRAQLHFSQELRILLCCGQDTQDPLCMSITLPLCKKYYIFTVTCASSNYHLPKNAVEVRVTHYGLGTCRLCKVNKQLRLCP